MVRSHIHRELGASVCKQIAAQMLAVSLCGTWRWFRLAATIALVLLHWSVGQHRVGGAAAVFFIARVMARAVRLVPMATHHTGAVYAWKHACELRSFEPFQALRCWGGVYGREQ
jgi:hypothetical protein